MNDLFSDIDNGARIRTLTNQIATTFRRTPNPTNIYEIKANQAIREARLLRERFEAGTIQTDEAEAKLTRLMLEAHAESRNEIKASGETPMLLPPEDTGYLL